MFFKEKAKQVDRVICKNVQRLRSTVVKGWGLFLFLGWKKQKGINRPFTEIKGVDFPFSSTRNFIITANHTLIHVYRLQILLNSRMSQDIFRLNIDETYRDWEGAIRIADDITVYGKNDTEHDTKPWNVPWKLASSSAMRIVLLRQKSAISSFCFTHEMVSSQAQTKSNS